MKYTYGLDLSMSCSGVAIFNQDGKCIHVCSIPTKDKDSHGRRLVVIATAFNELRKQYPVDKVIIERGFSQYNTSTQVIYRVHGLVNYLFADVEQIYYPPKKVKATLVSGTATKKMVQDYVKKQFPHIKLTIIPKKDKKTKQVNYVENEDESDAIAVGLTYFKLHK